MVATSTMAEDAATDEQMKAVHMARAREMGTEVTAAFIDAYRKFNRSTFEPLVSWNFTPDRAAFLRAVSDNYIKTVLLEFNFFVDTVTFTGLKLAVDLRWEKKTQDYGTTEPVLLKGKATFVFQGFPKNWQLVQLNGDNPF